MLRPEPSPGDAGGDRDADAKSVVGDAVSSAPPSGPSPIVEQRREAAPAGLLARWRQTLRRARTERIDHDLLRHVAASIESELDLHAADESEERLAETAITATVRAKLDEISRDSTIEENWSHVYHAEKLLIALFSDDRVRVELSRRLDRLASMNAPFASFYQGISAQIDDPARTSDTEPTTARRNLLVAMVNDIQLHQGKRFIKMRYARTAIYRIGTAFGIAFLIFILVLARGHWVPELDREHSEGNNGASATSVEAGRS